MAAVYLPMAACSGFRAQKVTEKQPHCDRAASDDELMPVLEGVAEKQPRKCNGCLLQ
ncbi:unnamed protein product [Effrenium voratum]|uniref:Uncharacterized protein n=1 Tax=Effrenium voratum TaxID=2562239 RepID=A0AA36JP77_9DINO|nr:unnamed protein product [Effrenium voratum]